jgi:TatD DNase family protein
MILNKNTKEFDDYVRQLEILSSRGLFFTDTHAHVHFKELEKTNFLDTCKKYSVKRIVTIGIDLKDSENALDFATKHQGVYAACGVHPHDSSNFKVVQLSRFENMLKSEKTIAVGEIGLDYFRNYSPKETQIKTFLTFADLAVYHKKPIIIHNRDSSSDIITFLEPVIKNNFSGGIIHCFNGDKTLLKWALDMGFYISYAGVLTYKKADDLRETLKYVPIDRLLVETDCPYLTPMPFRSQKNDPSFIVFTAYTMSEIINKSIEELAIILEKNFTNLFGKLETF